jgi:hypothetical protein
VTIDATGCCLPAQVDSRNPIDTFYGSIGDVLRLGDPTALAGSDALGRLLTLGIVTVTEAYFRSIVAVVVELCPLAREVASDQQIAYGALAFYSSSEIGLSLLEGISFTGGAEIKRATKNILGIELSTNRSLMAALDVYSQVCSMRHASVHEHGRLNRGNARVLNVRPRSGNSLFLVVNLPTLHTAASACTSVVRAYNGFVWERLVQRWLDYRILRGTWEIDKPLFDPVFRAFRSVADGTGPSNSYHAYLSIRPAIARRLATST